MKRKYGFTLIELLVVISVIAVLMSILMPSLRRAREQARQRSCSSRLRQQVLAMHMYADDNRGKFPLPKDGGFWLWDINVDTVNFMLQSGMTKEMFYCPSNSTQQKHMDLYWDYTGGWDGRRFTGGSYVVSGYCYLLELEEGERPEIRNYENRTGPKHWIKTNREKRQSDTELVIDSILGDKSDEAKYRYNFGMVSTGGMWTRYQIYDRTNHLLTDEDPQGGNIGYVDGHVDWRPFDNMEARYGGINDTPTFFW